MEHYTTNIKNMKFKNKISIFFSRISFGIQKLPIAGRVIIILTLLLFASLFFPWINKTDLNNNITPFYAFSQYSGYIGYNIIIGGFIILFFLISHNKKEQIRAYVPFRLSDVQAIVFVVSILITNIFTLFVLSPVISAEINFDKNMSFVITELILILNFSYFLSKQLKIKNTESYYLDHEGKIFPDEYDKILHPEKYKNENKDNMTLPF